MKDKKFCIEQRAIVRTESTPWCKIEIMESCWYICNTTQLSFFKSYMHKYAVQTANESSHHLSIYSNKVFFNSHIITWSHQSKPKQCLFINPSVKTANRTASLLNYRWPDIKKMPHHTNLKIPKFKDNRN